MATGVAAGKVTGVVVSPVPDPTPTQEAGALVIPPTPAKSAVTITTGGLQMLGSASLPSPAPWSTSALPDLRSPAHLERTKTNRSLTNSARKMKI